MDVLSSQNGVEGNTRDMNARIPLDFGHGKHHSARKAPLQGLAWIKPEMMQQVLSSISLSDERKEPKIENRVELMKLFPEETTPSNTRAEQDITFPAAVNHRPSLNRTANSRSASTSALVKQSTAQLTIFYNGAMTVYDVSAEKAEAVMKLASTNSLSKTMTPTITRGKAEEIVKPSAMSNQQAKKASEGLPIARKLSLQRFIQKRKDRLNSAAPFTAKMSEGGDEVFEEQINLSLSFPSQRSY